MPAEARRRRAGFVAICRLLFVALVAAAQTGCWEGTTRETLATVLSVDGRVEISSEGGRTFSPLRLSDTPGKGVVVRTGTGSSLSLALLPNCLVHLGDDTSVKIVRLALTKDGNETGNSVRTRLAEIQLNNGRILASHVWGEAQARFLIATPGGQVGTPSNALFWVEVADGKTRVTCVSGWIEFKPTDAPSGRRVPPGSIGEWPSADGRFTAASEDSRGQDALQQGIELEGQLRDLIGRKRNVLPR